MAFPGFSINGFVNSPNVGDRVRGAARLLEGRRDVDEVRPLRVGDRGALNQKFAQIQDAYIAVFPPPPIQGLGTIGGFKLQIEDRAGLGFEALYEETQKIVGAG